MLLFKEFVPRAPESGFIRVDHGFGCTGSSSALRIERLDNGDIKAYCFRCNQSGAYRKKYITADEIKDKLFNPVGTIPEVLSFNLPAGLVSDPAGFSLEALQWLNNYKLKAAEIKEHRILFNSQYNRLVFPIYTEEDELVFFQYRQLIDDGYPKYISYSKYSDRVYGKHIPKNTESVVIVEDIISAIKCSRIMSSFAMCGSHISAEDMSMLLKTYTGFIIFLDNDVRQVKVIQGVLKNYFKLFNRPVAVIYENKDPKAFNEQALRTILSGANYVI